MVNNSRTAVLLLPLLLFACKTPDPPPPATAVQALARCELPQDSVRYHLVVDRSGSMQGSWEAVRRQLAVTADSVAAGGYVHIHAFSDRVLTWVRDRQVVGAEARAELRERALLTPAPEPRGRTDIGRALEEAADAVEDARTRGLGRVTFLFVITDGRHDPPAGSRYADEGAFRPLAARWRDLPRRTGSDLIVIVVPIGSGGLAGAERVSSVIPDARVLPPTALGELGATLAGEVRQAGRNLLRTRVAREVARPDLRVRLQSSPQSVSFWGGTRLRAVVSSGGSCVTYRVTTGSDTGWVGVAPRDSALAAVPANSPRGWSDGWPWQGAREAASPPVPLRVRFAPGDELAALGVDTAARQVVLPAEGVVRYPPMGWPSFAAIVLPVLALLALLGVLLRWRTHRPRLRGRLVVRHHGDAASDPREEIVALNGLAERQYPVLHPNGRTLLTLEARGERGRTVVYALPGELPMSVHGKPLRSQALRRVTRFEGEFSEITYYPN